MSQDELILLVLDNIMAWSKEEAIANDTSFSMRYLNTCESFIDKLKETL